MGSLSILQSDLAAVRVHQSKFGPDGRFAHANDYTGGRKLHHWRSFRDGNGNGNGRGVVTLTGRNGYKEN